MLYLQIGDGFIVQLSITKTKRSPFQANDNSGLISNSIGKDTLSPLSKSSSGCFCKLQHSRWRAHGAALVFNVTLTVVVKSYYLNTLHLVPLSTHRSLRPTDTQFAHNEHRSLERWKIYIKRLSIHKIAWNKRV